MTFVHLYKYRYMIFWLSDGYKFLVCLFFWCFWMICYFLLLRGLTTSNFQTMQIAPRQYAAWVRSQKLGKCACGNKQIFAHSSKSLIFEEARTSQGFSAKEPKLKWQRWLEVNFLSVEEPASRSHVAAHCDGLVLISWSLHLPAAQLRSCGRILLHVMELEFRHDRPAS